MSEREVDNLQIDQRSSVEISLTAKGTRQWKVKVYAEDRTEAAADAALAKALALEGQLARTYGVPT